ncbi:hypothetical protein [Hydrogenophaga sp.]|uniref:hypothetical protein n=1 Tax=Hydrogenophaga sp. TaxID=1904254 RepID=UPI003D28BD47
MRQQQLAMRQRVGVHGRAAQQQPGDQRQIDQQQDQQRPEQQVGIHQTCIKPER